MRARGCLTPLLLLAVGLLLAAPGEAAAAADRVVRDDYSWFDDDVQVCGLTVDVAGQGTFRATIHEWVIGPNDPPADNFWLGNLNNRGSATFTNVATGESVVRTWVFNTKEVSMVDVGGGYWEYTYAQSGPIVWLGGRPIDVGRIVITDTLYLGNLDDESDFQYVGSTALFDAGRHPVFYDDQPFCDALVAAIG